MNDTLTPLQAFNAMQEFLEIYFKKTASDSIGALLSCMQFLEDGQTADQALWEDWISSLKDQKNITPIQAFDTMHMFLNQYYRNSSSANVKVLLRDIQHSTDGEITDQNIKIVWTDCVNKALSEPEGSRQYLQLVKE
jgi:hypothetical protein